MPKGLKRIYGQGHLHFITFSCYRRLPLLKSARARNIFVRALDQVRKEYSFKLVGYVVMPEHVHLLISEPVRGNPSTVAGGSTSRIATVTVSPLRVPHLSRTLGKMRKLNVPRCINLPGIYFKFGFGAHALISP